MTIGSIVSLMFTAIIVQNVILSQFLGTCPFLGVSGRRDSATGMGFAVVFVITLSSVVSWLLFTYVLVPFNMVYMKTIVFILVIASLVQIIEMFTKKVSPGLYRSLGIYLPLITTNCAVLGLATIVSSKDYSFLTALIYSFSASVGFLFVIYVFSTIREKINRGAVPLAFKGVPIALVTAAILAMIFTRLAGVI